MAVTTIYRQCAFSPLVLINGNGVCSLLDMRFSGSGYKQDDSIVFNEKTQN